MDITITISEKAEQIIRERAAQNGKDVIEFVESSVEGNFADGRPPERLSPGVRGGEYVAGLRPRWSQPAPSGKAGPRECGPYGRWHPVRLVQSARSVPELAHHVF